MEIQRESGIQSFASWPGYPTNSLAVWVMRNSRVPQRRIQVRYVTVTKMRGYSCTAEVPVVSVSAGESGTLTVSAVRFVARGRRLCANRSAFVVSPGI